MEKSTSQRSMTTGRLLITMPKLNYTAPIGMEKKTEAVRTDGKPFHNLIGKSCRVEYSIVVIFFKFCYCSVYKSQRTPVHHETCRLQKYC